jgi:hypothetical protein
MKQIDPKDMTPDQALRYLELAVKMERDALGIASVSKLEIQGEVNLGLEMSEEDFQRIRDNLFSLKHGNSADSGTDPAGE